MKQQRMLGIFAIFVGLCAFGVGLPITSKPYARSPDHLAWDTFFNGGDRDDSLEAYADGYAKPKKIHPKSIFIAPTLQNSVTCEPGYKVDNRGNCIQIVEINHQELFLNQLNQLLVNHKQQQQQQQNNNKRPTSNDEDLYDYDYDYEAATSPATKGAVDKGPFQLTIPVQLETESAQSPPQALQQTDPIPGSTLAAADPPTTTTTETPKMSSTTTKTPISDFNKFLEGLLLTPLNKDPFGLFTTTLIPSVTTQRPLETTETITEMTTNMERVEATTIRIPTTYDQREEDEEGQTTFSPSLSSVGTQIDSEKELWTPSEFATELAREQFVPVETSSSLANTNAWDNYYDDGTTTSTITTPEDLLSNAEGTTTLTADDNVEVDVTIYRGEVDSAVSRQPLNQVSESESTTIATTPTPITRTTTERTEATETVLPVQEMTTWRPFPKVSASSWLSSTPIKGGVFDWKSSPSIAIVTPVPNPFPFQRPSLIGNGGSLFKFTNVPVIPQTTTEAPTVPDLLLLGVENESERSQKMRESLMESEQKEMNYENIDANNRFVYHHLNGGGATTSVDQKQQEPLREANPTTTRVTDDVEEVMVENSKTSSSSRTTGEKKMTTTSLVPPHPSFVETLAAVLRPFDAAERRRVSPNTRWSPTTTTTTTKRPTTTTTSRFEEFLKSSSNRIRFPGPSVNRQAAANKLGVIGQQRRVTTTTEAPNTTSSGDKKPFWWLPTGWEVDTKQKEKPVLLRFWSRMPLIPDNVLSQRRSAGNNYTSSYNRSNRENSKSPSESLYHEVSLQDASNVFQEGRTLKSPVSS